MPLSLPAGLAQFWFENVSLPASLLRPEGAALSSADGLVRGALRIEGGRISAIEIGAPLEDGIYRHDLAGRIALPRLVDVHTHLDKGHIFRRAANPDGTFLGALTTVARDREANWHAADVRQRMDFALRSALYHGTGAIRTHLDSIGKQSAISWGVFSEIREEWRGRIHLQASALFPSLLAIEDPADFENIVAQVAKFDGVLGGVTFRGEKVDERLDAALDRTILAAKAHGFDLDFHVDESDSPEARTLERLADAVLRNKFSGKVLAGHCCSLALMAEADRARTIDKLGEAGIAIVSLPMCNLYLQDRQSGRTPRWRGVAPLHELDAAGISTMVASDNTRDPFYAYGDLDALEVYREATRILHFDHSARPWLQAISSRAADVMRIEAGTLRVGMPADLVILSARSINEMLSRPQSDRKILLAGTPLAASLPAYSELDALSA